MLRRLTLPVLLASACGSPPTPVEPQPASAQEQAAEPAKVSASIPDEGPGLAVGEVALPFALVDQHGKTRALDESLGKGLVAVVFFRSADW